jgi:CheY-like chemotaxis protein
MGESKAIQALFPGPRRSILRALFAEPERWWSLPELAGRSGLQPRSLRAHLEMLLCSGLIRQRQDNRLLWFQADPACPVYAEIASIIAKLAASSSAFETILVVEDQPATAKMTRILLESWGYRVLEAHGGPEAIDLFEQHGGKVHLLLTDVIMPGIGGPQLAGILLERNPVLRVVLMSGYSDEDLPLHRHAFLPKPFNPASLSRVIRRELDRPGGALHMNGS